MGKEIVLISALIMHYGITLFLGFSVCDWGFFGSIFVGTIYLLLTTAVIGTGLVAPAVIVCMLLAGLGLFNIFWLVGLITAAGISCLIVAD